MLRKKVWQKKIVHGDGIKESILHITIPEKKFPASSKSSTTPPPPKLNGRPLRHKTNYQIKPILEFSGVSQALFVPRNLINRIIGLWYKSGIY
jgi:hypothetical protein